VLIARNDKIAYFQAFGFRDRDQKIGHDHRFDLPYSIHEQARSSVSVQ